MLRNKQILLPLTVLITMAVSLCLATWAGAESYVFSREIKSGSFGSLAAPMDVSVGPDGKVYIADSSNFSVLVLDEYGNPVPPFPFSPSGFQPNYVSVSPNGNLFYVTNLFNNVFKVLPDGTFSQWGSAGSGNSQFNSPTGIAAAADGFVYVADTNNNRIQKFNSNGVFVTQWGSGDVQFNSPQAVAVDSSINLVVVADSGNNKVQAFDTAGAFLGSVEGFFFPGGVAFGPDHASVYVSETGNARIQKFSEEGITLIGEGLLLSPFGVSTDKGGNLYVADTGNNRIAVFTPDIVVLDKGVGQTVVHIPDAISVTLDLSPNAYWNGVASEIYAWAEFPGLGGFKAAYQGNDVWAPFDDLRAMPPLASGFPIPAASDVTVPLLSSTAGAPSPVLLRFFVCLDRQLDGVYNPSASVCGSVDITVQ